MAVSPEGSAGIRTVHLPISWAFCLGYIWTLQMLSNEAAATIPWAVPSRISCELPAQTSLQQAGPGTRGDAAAQQHKSASWSHALHSACATSHLQLLTTICTRHFWLLSYLPAKHALKSQCLPKLHVKYEKRLFISTFPRVAVLIAEFIKSV